MGTLFNEAFTINVDFVELMMWFLVCALLRCASKSGSFLHLTHRIILSLYAEVRKYTPLSLSSVGSNASIAPSPLHRADKTISHILLPLLQPQPVVRVKLDLLLLIY